MSARFQLTPLIKINIFYYIDLNNTYNDLSNISSANFSCSPSKCCKVSYKKWQITPSFSYRIHCKRLALQHKYVSPWFGETKISRQSHCIYTAFWVSLQNGRVPLNPQYSSLEMLAMDPRGWKKGQFRCHSIWGDHILPLVLHSLCNICIEQTVPKLEGYFIAQLVACHRVNRNKQKRFSYPAVDLWVRCGFHLVCLRLFWLFKGSMWPTKHGYFGLRSVSWGTVIFQLKSYHSMIL